MTEGCIALVTVLLLIPMALVRGWALSVLWAWFVVPAFGTPPLTVPLAIGLSLVVSLALGQDTSDHHLETGEQALTYCAWQFIGPCILLVMGVIVLQFV